MAFWPNYVCRNPACKSVGKSHPNCKCGPAMAKGGTVTHFCDGSSAHNPDCEYYAEGGDVAPSFDSLQDDNQGVEPKPEVAAAPQPAAMKFDDLKPDASSPQQFDELKDDSEKPDTVMGRVNAGIEGMGIGSMMGLGTTVEHAMGMKPEETEKTYPGSFETGKMIGMAMSPVRYIKAGSLALTGMYQMGAFQFGDELQDYLSGQKHLTSLTDDEVAATHIIGAAASGLFLGKAQQLAGAAVQNLQKSNIGQKVSDFAMGLGAASKGEKVLAGTATPWIEKGAKFYTDTMSKIDKNILALAVDATGGYAGGKIGQAIGQQLGGDEWGKTGFAIGVGAGGRIAQKKLEPLVEKMVSPMMDKIARKVAVPILLKAIQSGEFSGVLDAINYGTKAAKGEAILNRGVDGLFGAGKIMGQQGINSVTPQSIEKMKQYIDMGGVDSEFDQMKSDQTQGFAKGGQVKLTPMESSSFGSLYPEQNIALNAAKARVSNHLKTLKPQEAMGLPFDSKRKDPAGERKYDRAIKLAIQPMHVLEHIKDNKLLPEDIQNLGAMYPEVADLMKKKITEKIIHQQMKGEKPSYAMRQSLSMFLGSPLDSTFTPTSIQAAQSVFLSQSAQKQSPSGTKKSKIENSAKSYLTPDQSALSRQQKAR